MTTAANLYDGCTARVHAVELVAADGLLTVRGEADRTYSAQAIRIAEPFAQAPTVLYFDDGARAEVHGAEPGRLLREALGYRPTRVVRMTEHTWAALLALVLLVALLGAAYAWGVPALAMHIAATLPPSVDRSLGEASLKALDASGKLQESRLSDEWQAEAQAAMRRVAPPDMHVRLLLRNSPWLGPNAIALPDGTIVMTDQMVRLIVDKRARTRAGRQGPTFGAAEHAQLAGILAHEIGHVRLRHSVRMLASSSLTAALAASVFGDFSSVAALPTAAMHMSYSRDKETEADEYGIALMRHHGISTLPLVELHERLERHTGNEQSPWLRNAGRFIASHPVTAERTARLRAAAQGQAGP